MMSLSRRNEVFGAACAMVRDRLKRDNLPEDCFLGTASYVATAIDLVDEVDRQVEGNDEDEGLICCECARTITAQEFDEIFQVAYRSPGSLKDMVLEVLEFVGIKVEDHADA